MPTETPAAPTTPTTRLRLTYREVLTQTFVCDVPTSEWEAKKAQGQNCILEEYIQDRFWDDDTSDADVEGVEFVLQHFQVLPPEAPATTLH